MLKAKQTSLVFPFQYLPDNLRHISKANSPHSLRSFIRRRLRRKLLLFHILVFLLWLLLISLQFEGRVAKGTIFSWGFLIVGEGLVIVELIVIRPEGAELQILIVKGFSLFDQGRLGSHNKWVDEARAVPEGQCFHYLNIIYYSQTKRKENERSLLSDFYLFDVLKQFLPIVGVITLEGSSDLWFFGWDCLHLFGGTAGYYLHFCKFPVLLPGWHHSVDCLNFLKQLLQRL